MQEHVVPKFDLRGGVFKHEETTPFYSVAELDKMARERDAAQLLLHLQLMPGRYLKHSWEYELPKEGEFGYGDDTYRKLVSSTWQLHQRRKGKGRARTDANEE